MSSAAARTVKQFARIPDELKADASWVLWRYERRPEKPEKPTKVLRQANGRHADSTKPATWATFEAAIEAFEGGGFDGIGFVFHPDNPYCGADIDDVTEIEAQDWIDRFDSYTECSPSGNGFHIICKAEVPKGTNREEGELYSSGRFFTMTGDVVHDAPIREAQDAVDEFYTFLRRDDEPPAQRTAQTSPTFTDAEVVRLAENAKHGEEFSAIYRGGGHFKSGSERDLSLASRLAFWTQDAAQIERIMRGSGCAREKWDKHRTYLRDTIAKALDDLTEVYTPARAWLSAPSADPQPEKPAGDIVHVAFNGNGRVQPPRGFNLTDLGNSERFVADHGEDVRYCYPWRKWLVWNGARWERDDAGVVHRLAKETVRGIYREAWEAEEDGRRKELAKHATRSEAEAKIRAMLELAKSEVPISPDELDADPWLLNAPNGTLKLRTGELREHRREDLLTKMAGADYHPNAEAPLWAATLERVLSSPALRTFFKRLCGYAITGDVSEHILAVLYGTGANGKSTSLNALLEAAGDYGMQAAPDLLVAKKGAHPTEVADLFGKRLVASIEVEDGRRLAESLVKQLTGGDKVRARRMRQDFWEFDPTHKVFMAVNHKPEVRGTDIAIWRRIRLIPFTETIPPAEQDKQLPAKLRNELPGILAWAVEGCLEWQREGLQAPEEVKKATGQYRSEMDVIGAYLQDECEIGSDYREPFAAVYKRYEEWCEEGGERAETRRKFNARLKERGRFEARRSGPGGANEWHGLRLLKKQSTPFAGKLKQRTEKDYKHPENTPSRENGENNFSSSVASVDTPLSSDLEPGEGHTLEQLQRIRQLVGEGMAESAAREEVLGKGWVEP